MRVKTATCEWMRRISLILSITTFMFFWISFIDFSGAKTGIRWKDFSEGGLMLWIFIIVGAIIILLQLIPAIIMFFSFVGTGAHTGYKVIESPKEEIEITKNSVKGEINS